MSDKSEVSLRDIMSQGMDRRQFLRVATAAGLTLSVSDILVACGNQPAASTGSSAPATIRIQLNWLETVQFGGEWMAANGGYYAAEKLNPVWITGGPNAPRAEGVVAGGQADIGMSTFTQTTVDAIKAGADLVIFAAVYQHSPLALMSLPTNPIKSAQDMVGKKIGGPPFLQSNVDSLFKANGLPVHYTFVPVNGVEPDPLVSHQIDAMYVFLSDQPLIFEAKEGYKPVLFADSDNKFDIYSQIYFATKEYLSANRDAVVRYLRATIKGWKDNLANPAMGAKLAVNTYGTGLGLDVTEQTQENQINNTLVTTDETKTKGILVVTKQRFSGPVTDVLKTAGETNLPDVNSYVDETIHRDAYQSLSS